MKTITLSLLSLLFLISCSNTELTVSKYDNTILPDTTTSNTYVGYWTAMLFLKPELVDQYNVDEEKRLFAKALVSVKNQNYNQAEKHFMELKNFTKNDTIKYYSSEFLNQLLIYQCKWDDYFENNSIKDSTEAKEKSRLLFSSFIGFPDQQIIWNNLSDTIPIIFKSDLPFVKVIINGKEFNFIFDTGADISILSKEVADECGINAINKHNNGVVSSLNIASDSYTANIKEMIIGKTTIKNIPAMFVDAESMKFKILF
jgi:hypothetical protein